MRSPIDFAGIRAAVSIRAALERLGCPIYRVELAALRGPCPLCGDGRRSSRRLVIKPPYWYCLHCQAHGDVIALWAAVRRLGVGAAALDLCREFGIPMPRVTLARGTDKRCCP